MKVTLLVENNSLFTKYYNAEHGFSAWVEDEDIKVLYDVGYSDNFIRNAEAMGIDLRDADYVILSHSHHDHTGGLKYLLKYYDDMAMARKPVLLYTGEDIFDKIWNFKKSHNSGMDVSREILAQYFKLQASSEPVWLTQNLCFMGRTELTNDFEHKVPQGPKRQRNGEWTEDVVDEDTQLVYRHKNGVEASVVAGCAH